MTYKIRRSLLLASALSLVAVQSRGAEVETPVEKQTARTAIAQFRQNPLSPGGRAAGEIVRNFAEKSDEVNLSVTAKIVPFMENAKLLKEDRVLLLDAFVVGNVDAQLLRNDKTDDPYAGVTEMIQVYRQMQKALADFKVPEIDKFIDLEKRGELKKYIESP